VIVEIALGIILAVLILVFLPEIIGLGIVAIGIALIIVIAAAEVIDVMQARTKFGSFIR
jgi:hypothetical protein